MISMHDMFVLYPWVCVCACTYVSGSQTTSPLHFYLMMSSVTSSDKMEGRCCLWLESTPYRGKLSQEKFHCEFSGDIVICKSLSRKHFALAKPHNSLSMVIPSKGMTIDPFKVEVVKKMLQRATAVNDIPEFHLVPSGATPLMQAAGNAVGGKGLLSHLLFLSSSKAKGLIHSL